MPPHDPQLVFGALDNVEQPPQAFIMSPEQVTASVPSHCHVPCPQVPQLAPGLSESAVHPPQALGVEHDPPSAIPEGPPSPVPGPEAASQVEPLQARPPLHSTPPQHACPIAPQAVIGGPASPASGFPAGNEEQAAVMLSNTAPRRCTARRA